MQYKVWDKQNKKWDENIFIAPNGQLWEMTEGISDCYVLLVDDPENYVVCLGFKYGDTWIYEGDKVEITGATCNEEDFEGYVTFQNGTFCLAALEQSDYAKEKGYADLVRFWKDGCHDHHSLEMIEPGEMKVVGNKYTT